MYDLIKMDKVDLGDKVKLKKAKGYEKKKAVQWTPDLEKIINDVIDTLQSPAVMAYPNFDKPFILNCDASGLGLGAVLYQQQGEKLRVISYASRTLTEAEQNYHLHSGKLEFLALKWAVTGRFSDYLGHGSKFTVYTDNNPLTYVMTTAKLNATGMRWVTELADYDFVIKYRPGKNNNDADGLSRNPLSIQQLQRECTKICDRQELNAILSPPDVCHCQPVSVEKLECVLAPAEQTPISQGELGMLQSEDRNIGPVYKAVVLGRRPPKKEKHALTRSSKLLLHQWDKLGIENGVLIRKTRDYAQIVLPEAFHALVFVELHQKMGHLAVERVENLARQRFYWPNMRTDIEHFVKRQCSCVVTKKPNVPEKAPLKPIESTYPFEIISIDFLHLDKCKGGFEYVLVVCDHFTRFTQAYATRSKSSQAAADKLFNNFILQFGFPKRIHHDRGPEFNSNLFRCLHKLTGIRSSNTTPYHPMGDGQVERYNRTLINMLKSIPENEKKNWKEHLQKLTFAYNSTIHKSTGFSPFFLMFGRESRLPIDGILPTTEFGSKSESYGVFVDKWKKRMNEAFEIAQKHSQKQSKSNKTRYDAKIKHAEVQVGDKVLVQNVRQRGGTGKLSSYWEPCLYVVVKKSPDIPVYDIQNVQDKTAKVRKVHRNLLKVVNELVLQPEKQTKGKKMVKGKERNQIEIGSEDSSDEEGVLIAEYVKDPVVKEGSPVTSVGDAVSVIGSEDESVVGDTDIPSSGSGDQILSIETGTESDEQNMSEDAEELDEIVIAPR